MAKGYEVRRGEYVLLSDDEIGAAAGQRSRVIELEDFVCAAEIDPVFYDRTYYLGSGADGQDAYRLLHDALRKAERAGLGRWVFHNREYLVAVRPLDGALALHTMHFADELVEPADLDVPAPSGAPSRREIEMTVKLVDSLPLRFKPESFEDEYRERVLELIRTKARGEAPTPPEPEPGDEPANLMAALEASLQGHSRQANGSSTAAKKSSKRAKSGSNAKRGGSASSRSAATRGRSKAKG